MIALTNTFADLICFSIFFNKALSQFIIMNELSPSMASIETPFINNFATIFGRILAVSLFLISYFNQLSEKHSYKIAISLKICSNPKDLRLS